MKFTAIILIGLALLGGGCASSPGPSASKEPPWLEEPGTAQNAGAEPGTPWYVVYWAMYFGGQVLANR